MIERTHTNARMSKIVKHGQTVYLCGQVGSGADVTEQTRDCLSRVEALLDEAGSSKAQMLQAIVWLAHMSDFDAMNEVWDALIRAEDMARDSRKGSIVTLLCDSGERYLDTYYNANWVRDCIGDYHKFATELTRKYG